MSFIILAANNLSLKENNTSGLIAETDQMASSRKEDHIDLAFKSAVEKVQVDHRFKL